MKRTIEALSIIWPNGIPTEDFDKAILLGMRLAEREVGANPVQEAEEPRKYTYSGVSEEKRNAVRSHLASGPKTAKEISEATGIKVCSVYAALRDIAKPVARRDLSGPGAPAQVFALKDAEAAAPEKAPVQLIGAPGLQKIRDALSTGPATRAEVLEVTGLSPGAVQSGLRVVATITGTRHHPNGYTKIPLYTLKPEAK